MNEKLWLTLVSCLTYCINRELYKAIDYLREQVRVLVEQQEKHNKRILLTLVSVGNPPKPFPNKALTKSSQSDLVKITGEHPELVKLIKAWPELPVHIKQSINTLVEICKTPQSSKIH